MSKRQTYRTTVREIALDHYGLVTTKQAIDAGVPAVELPKLASRGGLENLSYGLYRISDYPPHEFDQVAEALLRAGEGSFLIGESVLALFSLANANPRRIKVGLTRRTRARFPDFMETVKVNPPRYLASYFGLNSQPVADALLACHGDIEPDRLWIAARQARDEGLIITSEWPRVRRELG